ncbi:hypothetical protein MD484_g2018, partial [Candolleomyces efflorescens]
MAEDPTEFFLPPSFPYPLTVISLDAPVNSKVTRGTRLLSYSYVYQSKNKNERPTTRFGTWDATAEGDLTRWNVKVGDVVPSHDKAVVLILEPCKHGVQLGGLCALCGKDLTIVDYTGYSDASRASIQMTHSAFGPTVSLEEAQRIERETANHLLGSRKLSLIVDLDQTVVHATVDPTVGEWIAEGESWEAKQAKKQAKSSTPTDSDDSSDESSDEEEECNPNWEALKDVRKFRLGPESFGNPSSRSKGKHKMVENDGCMYYIKARPGWKEFLEKAATRYEMHVYTMGTRAYAEQVCAILDPDKKIFGNRLLSRDESGSLTQKNLKRLFPCDTSMVVIIDDRADVWEWSPNLVKVIPYDFFVGIGDINSNFLPKVDPSTLAPAPAPAPTPTPSTVDSPPASDGDNTSADVNGDTTKAEAEVNVLLNENNAALDAQLEERPLAKKEKELQEHEEEEEIKQAQPPDKAKATAEPSVPTAHDHHHHRKALLKNDDTELQRVGKLLDEVHRRFFTSQDSSSSNHNRRSSKPDVTRIIPKMRAETLEGCHILFSGLIPLDTKPETAEVWRSATMFGAKCHTELTSEVTHVVAAKRGTVKVDQARKRGNIAIVSQLWLTESIGQWRKMDEKPYLLEEMEVHPPATHPPTSSPVMDIHDLSSEDPEMDEDDGWHKDPSELDTAAIDWNEINAEVDAAMNESDDDEEEPGFLGYNDEEGGQTEKEDFSDDGSVKSLSANNSPRMKRKRLRSLTPSEAGFDGDTDLLRSPLAKRKKVAAERSGLSRLKQGVTASDLGGSSKGGSENGSAPASPAEMHQDAFGEGYDDEDDDEDEEADFDLEDDFLARALEEDDEEVG